MSLEFRPFRTFSGHVQEVLLSYVVVLFAATRHSSPKFGVQTHIYTLRVKKLFNGKIHSIEELVETISVHET